MRSAFGGTFSSNKFSGEFPSDLKMPIYDIFNSRYQTLSKWLAGLLETVRTGVARPSVRDTIDFTEINKNLNLEGKQMLSLRISLFTDVPISEAIGFMCVYIQGIDTF